jgi:hypothetical protein
MKRDLRQPMVASITKDPSGFGIHSVGYINRRRGTLFSPLSFSFHDAFSASIQRWQRRCIIHNLQWCAGQEALRLPACRRERPLAPPRQLRFLVPSANCRLTDSVDFHLIDLLSHFDRERIPEVVRSLISCTITNSELAASCSRKGCRCPWLF